MIRAQKTNLMRRESIPKSHKNNSLLNFFKQKFHENDSTQDSNTFKILFIFIIFSLIFAITNSILLIHIESEYISGTDNKTSIQLKDVQTINCNIKYNMNDLASESQIYGPSSLNGNQESNAELSNNKTSIDDFLIFHIFKNLKSTVENYFINDQNLDSLYKQKLLSLFILIFDALNLIIFALICFFKKKIYIYIIHIVTFTGGLNIFINFHILHLVLYYYNALFHLNFTLPYFHCTFIILWVLIIESNFFLNICIYVVSNILIYFFQLGTNWSKEDRKSVV